MDANLKNIMEELLKTPSAKPTYNENQIHLRCKFCGDSDKDPNSAHLYVGVHNKYPNILGYHCKKCAVTGIVQKDFLEKYRISTTEYEDYFKSIKTKGAVKIYNQTLNLKRLNFKIPNFILDSDIRKVDYLSNRMGRKLNINDIKKYKIILNLKQFLTFNNIELNNYKEMYSLDEINDFSDNFVGFLSFGGNKITMRNLGSQRFKKKYMIFVIDPKMNSPFMYLPEIELDICSTNPEIVLAEGVMDIICVKEKFYLDSNKNTVFAACGASGSYKNILKTVMKMTGFIDANVTIYSDADISLDQYKQMFLDLVQINNFKIVYNKLSKDFGDISCGIDPEIRRL